jgi:uncharacterized small protein (DUF1192 family)
MAIDPEELAPRPKKPNIAIGEDLSALSVHELETRIAVFESEIARHREAAKARDASRNAADAVFKKS